MLNQVLKLGLFVTLGIWLRHRAKGLFALVGMLAVTWILHSEYLGYVSRSGDDTYLALSYAIKWGVFILAAGLNPCWLNEESAPARSLIETPSPTRIERRIGMTDLTSSAIKRLWNPKPTRL